MISGTKDKATWVHALGVGPRIRCKEGNEYGKGSLIGMRSHLDIVLAKLWHTESKCMLYPKRQKYQQVGSFLPFPIYLHTYAYFNMLYVPVFFCIINFLPFLWNFIWKKLTARTPHTCAWQDLNISFHALFKIRIYVCNNTKKNKTCFLFLS